jgi:hypothetical protein
MFMLSFTDPAIVLSMFMLSFTDPAIVLSMFMMTYLLTQLLYVDFLNGSESLQVF